MHAAVMTETAERGCFPPNTYSTTVHVCNMTSGIQVVPSKKNYRAGRVGRPRKCVCKSEAADNDSYISCTDDWA